MGRDMLNPVPVMTYLNKDRYAALLFCDIIWSFTFRCDSVGLYSLSVLTVS